MPDTLTGRCNCGAVTVRFAASPVQTRICWCRQCQKAAAGGAAHNAMFRTEDVALSGEVRSWTYMAASGNTLTQSFCPTCGTPIHAQSSARPQFITVRFGFLDQPHGLEPEAAIWIAEKPAWAALDPALPNYAGQPPPPPSS
jgi:hypothetical protein